MSEEKLRFRIQKTPNPLARKYVLSQLLKQSGRVSYQTQESCSHVPLAKALFHIPGVRQVHFFENVLTLTQDGQQDWRALDESVQDCLIGLVPEHNVDFADHVEKKKVGPKDPDLERMDKILDETIRPSLQMDGGDVELVDWKDGVLSLRYMGACDSCPSAMMGTLAAIKSVLESEYDDIEVVVV